MNDWLRHPDTVVSGDDPVVFLAFWRHEVRSCEARHAHASMQACGPVHGPALTRSPARARPQDFEEGRAVLERNFPLDFTEELSFEPVESANSAIEALKERRVRDIAASWDEHPETEVRVGVW